VLTVPADTTDDAAVRAAVDTKVVGYLRCARAVAPHMTAQGWGPIINISGPGRPQRGHRASGLDPQRRRRRPDQDPRR
jgi:NAD(P)-dependent dehydrogenase (short-subunit alcohol dehydrogenase family)